MNVNNILQRALPYLKKNWSIIFLVLMTGAYILTQISSCDNKAEVKELTAEALKYKQLYEACDTAIIDIQIIKSGLEAKLNELEIPDALVVEKDQNNWEVSKLREQVKRNKLKQVKLIGDRKADSIAFDQAIKDRDLEIELYEIGEKNLIDNLNEQSLMITDLSELLTERIYRDSIKDQHYTARYEATTKGTLEGFKLAVDVNPILIVETIATAAPTPKEYRYRNSINLLYTPYSSWDTKYNVSQKAGLEYERNMGFLKARLNYNYLIDTKDHEAAASIIIRPFRWSKKIK